jgi:lipopolysaccharide transport system ATP-binding protein
VLIIDEVLAVGDAQFQKKSLARMQAIATEGRTVLFVSHNMATIQSLCTRAIYLDHGKLIVDGTTNKVTEEYKKKVDLKTKDSVQLNKRKKDSRVLVSNIVTKNASDEDIKTFSSGEDLIVEVSYKLLDKKLKRISCAISLDSASTQQIVAYMSSNIKGTKILTSQKKRTVTFRVKNLPLNQDKYQLNVVIDDGKGNVLDWVRNALTIEVVPGDFYGNGELPPPGMGTTLLDYDVTL